MNANEHGSDAETAPNSMRRQAGRQGTVRMAGWREKSEWHVQSLKSLAWFMPMLCMPATCPSSRWLTRAASTLFWRRRLHTCCVFLSVSLHGNVHARVFSMCFVFFENLMEINGRDGSMHGSGSAANWWWNYAHRCSFIYERESVKRDDLRAPPFEWSQEPHTAHTHKNTHTTRTTTYYAKSGSMLVRSSSSVVVVVKNC